MLQLRINDYTLSQLISNEYRRYDVNIRGRNGVPNVGYVRGNTLEAAMAPIALNGIGIMQKTYCINEANNTNEIDTYLEEINTSFEQLSDTRLAILRVYTEDVEGFTDKMSSDIFINPPTAIQELYNKCIEQSRLRESITAEGHIRIKVSRAKHVIVIITDYLDPNQGSDMFLTIGLTPVLFQDWKDKFNEDELEYFKTLVNRSQVKRISNVKACETFNEMIVNDKYQDQIKELELKNTVEGIVTFKERQAQYLLRNSEDNARDLLNRYHNAQRDYYAAYETLKKLESSKEDTLSEIAQALKIDGIVHVNARESVISIDIKAPLIFYNEDEADIIIDNMDDNWVKEMFTDVFIEHKYKLNAFARFYFDFNLNNSFRSPGATDLDLMCRYQTLFNPHFYFYSCLGDYKTQLIDAQSKGDLLMFNNIALAAVKSINFRDGAVINKFKEFLNDLPDHMYSGRTITNIKCLEDEDGNTYSMYELYLKPQTEPIDLEVGDA